MFSPLISRFPTVYFCYAAIFKRQPFTYHSPTTLGLAEVLDGTMRLMQILAAEAKEAEPR